MRADRARILRFALFFPPLFAAAMWFYPDLLPGYQRLVVGAADAVLRRLDPPIRMAISRDGGWEAYLLPPPGGEESFLWSRLGKNLHLVYLGAPLLAALLLATPAGPWRRLCIFAIGMVLLYLSHVLAAVVLVRSVHCLQLRPESAVCAWSKTVVNAFGQVIAAVLWGGLTWSFWLSRPPAPSAPPAPGEGVSAPRPGL